jgi:hypothetical protein
MRRFKGQNLPIHYVHRRRNPDMTLSREHMPELELSFRCRQDQQVQQGQTRKQEGLPCKGI